MYRTPLYPSASRRLVIARAGMLAGFVPYTRIASAESRRRSIGASVGMSARRMFRAPGMCPAANSRGERGSTIASVDPFPGRCAASYNRRASTTLTSLMLLSLTPPHPIEPHTAGTATAHAPRIRITRENERTEVSSRTIMVEEYRRRGAIVRQRPTAREGSPGMMSHPTTQRCGCLLGVAGAMGVGWFATGQPGGFGPSFEQRATPKLIAEHEALVPGTTATLAVTFEISPGWHMYWRGQNDTGMGPTISWSLPQGYEVGETQWPVPIRKVLPGGILDHIYEDRLTILVPLRVPSEPAAGSTPASPTASIGASLRWMVCDDVCMFEDGNVALTIPVAPRPEPATNTATPPLPLRSADARLIDDARKALPLPWSDAKGLARSTLDVTDERVTLSIQAAGATRITFIPDEGCLPPMDLLRHGDAEGESLKIDFASGGEDGERISGLVRIEQGNKMGARTFRFHEVIVRAAEDRGVR